MTKLETDLDRDFETACERVPQVGGREAQAANIDQPAPEAAASGTLRVIDNFPEFIPVSSKELAAIEMFMGGLIDALVKPPR